MSSPSLKLISLNIERAKHYDRVFPFLQKEDADVVCLQEVREPDIPKLREVLGGAEYLYAPMNLHPSDGDPAITGTAIFSRLPTQERAASYYVGQADKIPGMLIKENDDPIDPTTMMNCALTAASFEKDGERFRIAQTHFMWSPDGRATDAQRRDMKALLNLLEKEEEFVLCGDFNAPRGGEIFAMLAEKYTDNVPPEYVTSLDYDLHRAGRAQLEEHAQHAGVPGHMVDGLFSTPAYFVSDVRMVSGVSDHCALVATVQKRG